MIFPPGPKKRVNTGIGKKRIQREGLLDKISKITATPEKKIAAMFKSEKGQKKCHPLPKKTKVIF